jgi:hypothetical protein
LQEDHQENPRSPLRNGWLNVQKKPLSIFYLISYLVSIFFDIDFIIFFCSLVSIFLWRVLLILADFEQIFTHKVPYIFLKILVD